MVLDPFVGSGSTILAAQRTGRKAMAIEFESKYVDVAIRRFQDLTGIEARLAGLEESFTEVAAERGNQHG
jgi:DNA modification methylase